jgi:hypothetical protein
VFPRYIFLYFSFIRFFEKTREFFIGCDIIDSVKLRVESLYSMV